jgi:diguanylate cyclase (GGDEF)-like protein
VARPTLLAPGVAGKALLLAGLSVGLALVLGLGPREALQYGFLYFAPLYPAAYWFGLRGAYTGALATGVLILALCFLSSPAYAALGGAHAEGAPAGRRGRPATLYEALRDPALSPAHAAAGVALVISGALLAGWLVDRNHQTAALLRDEAATDPLTGLPNRRQLEARLALEAARSRRRGASFAVLMLDVDHFKRFNDTHGHQGGDEALRAVARALAAALRAGDFAVRYGGEEFAVVLPDTDAASAASVAERVRERVEGLRIAVTSWESARATVSIGLAACPEDAEEVGRLVARADTALYAAKQEGRNRVRRWDPGMDDKPAAPASHEPSDAPRRSDAGTANPRDQRAD